MGIALFIVLTLIVAAIIAYPLLPGRRPAQAAPAITDGEIELAVQDLRQARSAGELACPTCAHAYRPGDLFCVRCGGALPQVDATEPACPACGAPIREGDSFCAKCGHQMAVAEEAA